MSPAKAPFAMDPTGANAFPFTLTQQEQQTLVNPSNPLETRPGPVRISQQVFAGLSVLDYFAGQALAGMLAQANSLDLVDDGESFAHWCYGYAEAMVRRRFELLTAHEKNGEAASG